MHRRICCSIALALTSCVAETSEEEVEEVEQAATDDACWGAPVNTKRTIRMGDVERVYYIHTPPSYDCFDPVPVVLNFHGGLATAAMQAGVTGMSGKADEKRFIAIHPQGIGNNWNAGTCCPPALGVVDDVAFARAIIDDVSTLFPVDEDRIYATGMSAGGMLANRLACEASDLFAAVGAVAGPLMFLACDPERATPILHIHGTADGVIPYQGGMGGYYPNVPQSMKDWAARNGCSTTSTQVYMKGDSSCVTFDGCPEGIDVKFCTVDGGGHTWPGGLPFPLLGKTTYNLFATDEMWSFFAAHPR